MAIVLTSCSLNLSLLTKLTNGLDLSSPVDNLSFSVTDSLTNGDAIDLANMVWHDRRTLGAATTEDIDLAASLTSAFGTTLTFTKIKGLFIKNRSVATDAILSVGGDTNSVPLFGATNDLIKIGPDGLLAWWNPAAAGIAVTAGTGDIIQIANAGAASADYDIVIVGVV
jgi:hypothetical protein